MKQVIPYDECEGLRKGDIISSIDNTIYANVVAIDSTGHIWINVFLRKGKKEFHNKNKRFTKPRFKHCYRGFTTLVFLKDHPEFLI